MAGIVALKDNVKLFLGEAELTASDKIGRVASISDIGGESEEIEVTTLDSMAKEFEMGFEDNGSLEITLNLGGDDEYVKMDTWKKAGTQLNWGLSTHKKDGTQFLGLKGVGFVKSVKLTGMSVGSALQVVVSIRLSGEITTDFVSPTP